MVRATVLALAVLAAGAATAAAQAPADTALVLGGGGARGIAHAGALVGLERRGYDPDLVVGTSMGSIVGALYAAGYSADEVWRIMADENWPELFVPTPLPVGPERDRRHPLVRFGVGGTPVESIWGVVPDWRIDRRLVQLLFDAGARARGDFDRLPRRFRAIAADLETGDVVPIGRGDLARAVRASMAVPGFFSPVRWDDRVLVDGGIASNLPIVEAREVGADVVVAVDVIRPPPTLDGEYPVTNPVDAGARAFRLLLENTIPDGVRADELVLPDISPAVSSAAFPRDATPLLRAGLEGALRDLPLGAGHPPQPRRPPPPPETLGDIVVETSDASIDALVRAAFRDAAPGPYRAEAVLEAVDRLYATGFFEAVWPRVVEAEAFDADVADDADGEDPVLVVRADPVPRTAVGGAAGYEADRGFRAWGTLAHRIDAGAPAELGFAGSSDGIDRWASASARLASLRLPPVVWTAGAHYREADARIILDGEILAEPDVDRTGGWIGVELADLAPELTASALLRAEHVDVENGEAGLSVGPFLRITDPTPFTRVVGLPTRLELDVRAGDVGYARVHVRGSARGARGALRLAAIGDVVFTGGDAPIDVLPALGDEHLMPGFRWDEARGRARVVGGLDVAYPAPFGGFARLELRAGAAPDDVDLDAFVDEGAWALGAGLGLVWSTPFGSLEVGVGANTRDRWRVEFDIGPRF